MTFNVLDTLTKPKVNPAWQLISSFRAYDKYLTGRNDIVRFANDPFVHIGDIAFGMSERIWLHTLCGVTYAVYPDPRTATLRHDVVILQRHPPGAMRCVECLEWKRVGNEH